jgi:hypothetical protein
MTASEVTRLASETYARRRILRWLPHYLIAMLDLATRTEFGIDTVKTRP